MFSKSICKFKGRKRDLDTFWKQKTMEDNYFSKVSFLRSVAYIFLRILIISFLFLFFNKLKSV